MCKYCDEDRIIEQGAIYFGNEGMIACINSKDEFVVNIKGEQMNIPIDYCPFCGDSLDIEEKEDTYENTGFDSRYEDEDALIW